MFIFEWCASILSTLYDLTGSSFTFSIALLTVSVMVLTLPFAYRSRKGALKSQLIQPQINQIKKEHADDPKRSEAELRALHKEHGASPLGGCIPQLLQLPAFIVVYRTLLGLTRRSTDSTVDGKEAFDPAFLDSGSQMFADLISSSTMEGLGMDLSLSLFRSLGDVSELVPHLLLAAAMGLTVWGQQRFNPHRSNKSKGSASQLQKQVQAIVFIVFAVVVFTVPASLVVYLLGQGLWRIGQQFLFTRLLFNGEDSLGEQVQRLKQV